MLRLLVSIVFYLYTMPIAFAAVSQAPQNDLTPGEGLQAEGKEEWQQAIAVYLDTLLTTPNRIDLWLRIASIEHQLKNYQLAINAYQHALYLQPNNPKLHKTLSEVYAEIHQPANALVAINNAVKLEPNNEAYLDSRAKIANWNKSLQPALDSFKRLLLLSKNTKTSFDLLVKIGDIQYQLIQHQEAIISYNNALKIQPSSGDIYLRLSQIYSKINDHKSAIESIDKALEVSPKNLQYLHSKALLYLWSNNYKLSLDTYQKILAIYPKDKAAIEGEEKTNKLIKIPGNFGGLKPENPLEKWIRMANNASIMHRYSEATFDLKQAIILKPNDPGLYKKLSETYAEKHQATLALSAINKAIIISPKNIEYLRARGKLAAWSLNKKLTEESYERILQLKPKDQDALLQLAHTLAWQGKTDTAIHAYQQLLYYYPQTADGWLQYAEVLSWTANFIDALDALNHYKKLNGETTSYLEIKARVLALIGRFNSSMAINDPLLQSNSHDTYAISTEVTALIKANQINNAMHFFMKLGNINSTDNQLRGLKQLTLTPYRSNINLQADYTAASDTTRITDIPVSLQYFLNPTTSLLLQGLYERATAAPTSGLGSIDGNGSVWDKSVKAGIATQIASLNLKGLLGDLKIQNKKNHVIYDAAVNTNLGETAQISLKKFHDLYRAYLVPQTPRSISLQIMETRYAALLEWQPFTQKYLNLAMSYSNLSDNNHYIHFNAWPKSRIYSSEHWLVTVGVDGDFWHYNRRAMNGYYSPIHFEGYEGTVELYYAQSENIGYGFSGGFGMQKDETFPHYFYEEDLAMQLFFGIFTDWELKVKSGFTLRNNPTDNYYCWSAGLVLTRRF